MVDERGEMYDGSSWMASRPRTLVESASTSFRLAAGSSSSPCEGRLRPMMCQCVPAACWARRRRQQQKRHRRSQQQQKRAARTMPVIAPPPSEVRALLPPVMASLELLLSGGSGGEDGTGGEGGADGGTRVHACRTERKSDE